MTFEIHLEMGKVSTLIKKCMKYIHKKFVKNTSKIEN